MAVVYALSEFTDEKGTDWKVQIVDGTISSGNLNHAFKLGPDGFRLTYDFNNYDRAKPIIGSKVDITLFHPDDNDAVFNTLYSNLDTAEEGTYRLEIYRDPDGTNETWWVGEILPEQTIIPDAYPHAAVNITAADGLGNLKEVKYNNDGSPYNGSNNIITHIYKALTKVHSANFWGGGDILCSFLEDFIGAEYKTHIGVGQNQQLKNAWVEHNTFYKLDDEGNKEYFNCYEVLESLAIAFNSCIFMAQGRFWFVPLGALQGHADGDLNISHDLQGGGVVAYNTSTNVTYAAAFGNNSADLEKLAGWERTTAPAFKEVVRTRNYQGDKPILFRSELAIDTLIQDEDADRPTDQQLIVSGRFNYTTEGFGVGSLSGVDKIARLFVSLKVRVGDAGGADRYLSRTVTYPGGSLQNNVSVNDSGAISHPFYYLPLYSDFSWSASSSSRVEIISDPFDITTGITMGSTQVNPIFSGFDFNIITPPIAADAEGTQLEVGIKAVDHNGVVVADWINTSHSVYYVSNLGAWVYDNNNSQTFGTYEISSTNAQDARFTLKQGTTLIGDKITESDLGVVKIFNGSAYVDSSQWTSLQSSTGSLSLNGLGVKERLGANKNSRRIERGTVFKVGSKYIHPYSVLTNSDEGGTKYYQVTGLKHIAARCEYDLECMYLNRDVTDITVAIGNKGPSTDGPGFPTVAIGNKGPQTGDSTVTGINEGKTSKITTDAYGITDLKISNGSSGTWDFGLPTAAAAAGKTQPMSIRDDGNVVFTTIGTAGQVLTVNATATGAAFADASGGESGWFNSTTLMKVMPTEFMLNDDNADDYLVIEDDTTDKVSVRIDDNRANGIAYAIKAIPTGYKATHVQVYGVNNSGTSNPITVRNFDHTDGDLTNTTSG
ncbi:MAG: hypothetical protein ACR2M9_01465, partial [Cyanophyceae cyanobacterium]